MGVPGIGRHFVPEYERPLLERCWDSTIDICKKVVEAVSDFFSWIAGLFVKAFEFIFCIDSDPPQVDIEPIIRRRFDEPEIEPAIIDDGLPVDVNRLKEILRAGLVRAAISRNMKAEDFSALCRDYPIRVTILRDRRELRALEVDELGAVQPILDEIKGEIRGREGDAAANQVTYNFQFPPQRVTIGTWARNWAQNRPISIDPAHPYFEIFQEAIRLKGQIPGGALASGDYRTYGVNDEGYLYDEQFFYLMKSLMGFQEFSRDSHKLLFRQLDNRAPEFDNNPCYKFGRALSKIYCYPTGHPRNWNAMDVNDKLQIGIGAPWAAYQAAREQGKTLEFFNQAFRNQNCFDARVNAFQAITEQMAHPNILDFTPNLGGRDTADQILAEYHRVFRNHQIARLAREEGIPYPQLRDRMTPDQSRTLFRRNCTRANFAIFLEAEGFPARKLEPVPAEQPIPPIVPIQRGWNQALPKRFQRVPLHLIPAANQRAGAIVGVRDPVVYIATVAERAGRYSLQFEGAAERRHNDHPLIDYQIPWKGLDRQEIDVNLLPRDRQRNGAKIRLMDPAVYQLKFQRIDGDVAILDCRGEPIPRAEWQAILGDEYWTSPFEA